MQSQKKRTRKKLSKKRKKSQSEPFGYQPNNPLTKYYAKFIESKTKI